MKNALIINAHQRYEFSEGALNAELMRRLSLQLTEKGYDVRLTSIDHDWDVQEELDCHQWADVIIVQSPVNWMGVPWKMKKYMDEVYTAGMFGALCNRDGRSSQTPKDGYGTGVS